MKKKLISLLLCTVIGAGLLSGCGSSTDTSSSASDTSSASGTSSASDAATSAEDMTTVSLYIPTLATYTEDAIQEVQAAVNEYLAENYGIQAKLTYIEIGNFEQAINLAMTTDELDVTCYFTGEGQLANYVRNGQLLDITDRFAAASDEVKNTFTDAEVLASSMDGRMYGFVRKYQYGGYGTVVMNADIVDELGIDAASIDSFDKLGEVLYQVHEAHPEIYALVPQSAADMSWLTPWVSGVGLTPYAYTNDNDSTELKSLFELDSFREWCDTMNKWYRDGLIMADAISNTREGTDMVSSGAAFAVLHNADIDPLTIFYPNTVEGGRIFAPKANCTDIGNLQYGISSNSAHPDEAFTLLCAMYTDARLHTLLSFGIEGRHYVINAEGKAEYPEGMTAETEPYGGFTASATYPNYLLNPVRATAAVDDYAAAITEWDAQISVPASFGFFFDTSAYGDFITAYKNIDDKYTKALLTGTIALDDVLPDIQSELTAIGFYDVLAETQNSLDAWLTDQNN